MAISERQRQKKLKKKKKRQQLVQAERRAAPAASGPAGYAHLPVHECLIPGALFEVGIGDVVFARRLPGGRIAASLFLVDVFCLGVKNAFFACLDEVEYEEKLKAGLVHNPTQGGAVPTHPACVRKLVEGAVQYAAGPGFSPHRDYRAASKLFGNVDAEACPTRFEYGHNGMPLYIRGPHESLSRAKRIVEQLHKRCGVDGCHIMLDSGPV